MSVLWRFAKYVKPYWWALMIAVAAGLGKFIFPLATPLYTKYVLDNILLDHAPEDSISSTIDGATRAACRLVEPFGVGYEDRTGRLGGVIVSLLILGIANAIVAYARNYTSGWLSNRVCLDLRCALFQQIQRQGHAFFDQSPSGGIVSRVINDIGAVQRFVQRVIITFWLDIGFSFVMLFVLFSMNVRMAIACLTVIPFYLFTVAILVKRVKRVSKDIQEQTARLSANVQEVVSGISEVKAFTAEKIEEEGFFEKNEEWFGKTLKRFRFSATTASARVLLNTLTQVVVLGYGGYLVVKGNMTPGALLAFYGLSGKLTNPIGRFSEVGNVAATGMAALERVFEIFDRVPDVTEKRNARKWKNPNGRVEFGGVVFEYESGSPVLRDVSFQADPGETVALVGPSGSGKSTIANLLPRFYDVTDGSVMLDGVDVRDFRIRSLRRRIGIVRQDPILFSGSIYENILYGRPGASTSEVIAAAKHANAHDFIVSLAEGYDTVAGERGMKLSGGQRQRIALARAFLKNPHVLILDEATSALDSESESLIQQALERLLENRTAFVIAHRLSTVQFANRILVLEEGRLVESGTHEELIAADGAYRRLCEFQSFQPV